MVLNLNSLSFILSRRFLIVVVSALLILLSLPPFGISLFYWVGITFFFYFLLSDQNFSIKYIFCFFLFNSIHQFDLDYSILCFWRVGVFTLRSHINFYSVRIYCIFKFRIDSINLLFFSRKKLIAFFASFKLKHYRLIKRIYHWWLSMESFSNHLL